MTTTERLEWLTEVDGEYAYVGGEHGGGLYMRSDEGDTLLPPHEGRFVLLGEVADRADAVDVAREWEAQRRA
jgi:hypothetical protein